ncbi:TPA: hypothetical protein LVL54_001175 [Klebsiella michiganensis]|uniref:hypothetical protein n=1 Tax=Klebsiella michiganensis TaxID=1134687 RepID=UPI0007CBBB73|nr:hypothetical protein [Klebsiella michiganensis]SAP46590.1 Uncharacterised protein [Klebsiella michiganensis]SBL66283.1 Uncharacterised protein [Klebsiella michiganensis]HBM2967032.1 hypothetical protein [Klebsiella michiganensis]
MTSKLTRERIELIANFHRAMMLPPSHDEIEELARMAMVAMDSEPVAWLWSRDGDDERDVSLTPPDDDDDAADAIECGWTATPLYRHAQQSVVPDDYQRLRELYHAQEKRLFKIAQRIKGPSFDKYSHTPSQAIDVLEGAIFGEDDACRAAMLNHPSSIQPNTDATPGAEIKHPSSNSPVIPEGYVMVPKEPTPEMLEVINEAIKSMRGSAATYARVLAAAPQEVK